VVNVTLMQENGTQFDHDVLIIGGGLVGASLACALGGSDLRVAVVEAVPLGSSAQPSYDDRTIALAYGSRRIFEAMGVWDDIEANGAYPIRRIHISDRGHFGIARLAAADAGVEALGYVAANRAVGSALLQALDALPRVTLLCPAEVVSVEPGPEAAVCTIRCDQTTQRLRTRLVVVADGGRSGIADALGLPARRIDYQQSAIVTNVTPGRDHEATAYERFTETGPLAILPMDPSRCAVVWSARPQEADTILGWSDAEFLSRLQARFGQRLGRFKRVGKRQSYPLFLTQRREHIRPRVALIGNAAHAVHPVAGQGFNLGLRDVATLAQVLSDAVAAGDDPGTMPVLREYARWRRGDNLLVTAFTDGLVRVFSNAFPPLMFARNLGLLGVDILPSLKRAFTRRTSGLHGRLPRLARGLPLAP